VDICVDVHMTINSHNIVCSLHDCIKGTVTAENMDTV